MDFINSFHIEKTQEGRKKKQKVTEVEAARVDEKNIEEEIKVLILEILKGLHLKMRKLQMNILLRLLPMRLSVLLTKRVNKINVKE
jgi:hypothetical protein